jgi:hypothetical protein
MFFVNEKIVNTLAFALLNYKKIVTLSFIIAIATLNDAIKLQYPEK